MSAQDNATKLGKPNQNLVLETAGRIYVKVQDRFYELDFRNQNNKSVVNVTNNITEAADSPDLSGFVTKKYLKASLAEYVTKRTWAGIKETTNMLENALLEGFTESISPITINTMQLVVGSEQLQYDFITDFTTTQAISHGIEELTADHLELNECYIKHYTINGPNAVRKETAENTTEIESQYCRWHIAARSFDLDDGPYYLYLKVPILGDSSIEGYPVKESFGDNYMYAGESNYSHSATAAIYWKTNAYAIDSNIDSLGIEDGEYVISQSAISFDSEEGYYHLLFAIINSASDDGEREFTTMNGFTEITPGRITAYRFVSPDGNQYLNFLDKTFHLGDAALAGEIPDPNDPNTPNTNANGSYIHWDPKNGLMIKGKVEVTGGDLDDVLSRLQNQLDGSINSWFSGDPDNDNDQLSPAKDLHCEPTKETWPAHTWNHQEEDPENPGQYITVYDYENHLGDLYYITDDTQAYKDDQSDPKTADTYKGFAYRFVKETDSNSQVQYKWVLLSDDSISEALRIAYENRDKIAGYDYLKAALMKGATSINGGLVLSNLIQLGEWDQILNDDEEVTNTHFSVWSGINGLQEKTQDGIKTHRDIAAWYGGAMWDKEDFYRWDNTTHQWILKSGQTDPGNIPKTVFRHDGSGYLANGNIFWESNGSLRVPGITLEKDENQEWKIVLDSGSIISGTDQTLGEYNAFFEVDDSITINGKHPIRLKDDQYAGIWSEGFGSFGGINPNTSVNVIESIWNSLIGNTDSYSGRKIHIDHIPFESVAGTGLTFSNGKLNVTGGGSGDGSVTSITLYQGTGIAVSNSGQPITTSGERTISLSQEYQTKISNLENRTDWSDYFEIVDGNIHVKGNRGFYGDSFGSFGGLNSSSTSSGITLERVWQSLDKTYTDSCASVIDSSFLPIATQTTAGTIKVGSGLAITDGVLSVVGGGSGGSGTVTGVQFDNNVTYTTNVYIPDANGIVKLPPYSSNETWTDYFGIDANGNVYVKPIVDETNQTSTPRGFYNEGFGSFGGLNNSSNSGISLDRVWQSLVSNSEYVTSIINPIHIPIATNSTVGGIKTDYTTDSTNKNYAVQVDNSGNAYVNVPWSGGSGGDTPSVLPNLYVAQTLVSQTSTVGPLLGISGITNTSADNTSGDLSYMYWDGINNAWHLKGNLIADGYGSFGGVNGNASSGTSLADVWTSLTTNSDSYANSKININHIPTTDILSQYNLPIATTNDLGGVKVGSGLSIANDGTLSANLGDSTELTIGNKVYGVGVTANGKLAVSVPWTGGGGGGSYTGSAFININNSNSIVFKGVDYGKALCGNNTISSTSGGTYSPVQYNTSNDSIYVIYPVATEQNGGTALSLVTSGEKYVWNHKGNGTVTSVTATGVLSSSGGTTPAITHNAPTTSPAKSTEAVYPIKIDSYGHIISAGTAVTFTNTTYKLSVNGNVNGDSTNGVDLGTIYAPTSTGISGQFLIANNNGIPSWQTKTFLSSVTLSDLPKGSANTVLVGNGTSTAPSFSASPTVTSITATSITATSITASSSITINDILLQKQTSTPDGLKIYADVISTGKFYDSSDIRLKTNIKDINNVLSKLDDIPIVQYEYLTQKDHKYIGTLAQSLLSLYPELVNKDDNGYYSVDYGGLAAVAIAGLKELSQKVKSLEAKLYGYEY